MNFPKCRKLLSSLLGAGVGFIAAWVLRGPQDRQGIHSSRVSGETVDEQPGRLTDSAGNGSAKATIPGPTAQTGMASVSPPPLSAAEDTVVLPRGILGYLKADAVNTLTMEFRPAILAALGLSAAEGESMNRALKSITEHVASFQFSNSIKMNDRHGGEFYLVQSSPEEKEDLRRKLRAEVAGAIPDADPAVAEAAWHLLSNSPVLQDLAYGKQEISVINSSNFSNGEEQQPTIELKQFDENGNNVVTQTFLATPSLVKYRFPFLRP